MSNVSTIETVSHFLKDKGLRHSAGSWKDLLELRVAPAVLDNQVTEAELALLLADAEEHGRQHIFLYRASREDTASITDEKYVRRAIRALGLEEIGPATVADLPEEPMVASVRYFTAGERSGLLAQIVQKRLHKKYQRDRTVGNKYFREYEITEERAIHVARLRPDGLLELRVRSHLNSSKYSEDVGMLWTKIQPLLPRHKFEPLSLQKAKDKLLANNQELGDELIYSDAEMINDKNTKIILTRGTGEDNLFEDEAAQKSYNDFSESEGAMSQGSNVTWKAQKNGRPAKNVRVMLSGDPNEFAMPGACVQKDYDYVLQRLLTHGR
jgi:hypothetical protein